MCNPRGAIAKRPDDCRKHPETGARAFAQVRPPPPAVRVVAGGALGYAPGMAVEIDASWYVRRPARRSG